MGGGGFGLDSVNSLRNNRSLLKDKGRFKSRENYFISLEKSKSYKKAPFSKLRGTHYKTYKNSYYGFIFKIFYLILTLILIFAIMLQIYYL